MVKTVGIVSKYGEQKAEQIMSTAIPWLENRGMDVLVVNRDAPVHLLHNVVAKQRHWISFRVLNRHGADAMEATIRLSAGRVSKRRNVKSAYSYQAANDPRIHVGLGDIDQVLDVQVRWADGELELFGDFDADLVITLRRGSGLSRQ